MTSDSSGAPDPTPFWLRRLHSLTGIVPLGLYVAVHLATQSRALDGAEAYDAAMRSALARPFAGILEWSLVLLPLAYHGIHGLFITYQARPTTGSFPTPGNITYLLMRVTGVATFVFIAWHVWMFRMARPLYGLPTSYASVSAELQHGWVFALHVAGVASVVFHLAAGAWSFGITWGITASRRSQRLSALACASAGVLGFVVAMSTLLAFRPVAWRFPG